MTSAAAVQVDEEALILELIADMELPRGVSFNRLEFGADWEGEPAWYAYFTVSKTATATKRFIGSLGQISAELHRKFFPFHSKQWVYVEFEDAE